MEYATAMRASLKDDDGCQSIVVALRRTSHGSACRCRGAQWDKRVNTLLQKEAGVIGSNCENNESLALLNNGQ